MGGDVTSSSAIATLNVTPSLLASDTLLHLISSLASPLQLEVSSKKKNALSLTLNDGTLVLTERNAILRALCGPALHNALDKAPYYLLGGHVEGSFSLSPNGGGGSGALALAGISSWMSVAASIREDHSSLKTIRDDHDGPAGVDGIKSLLGHLDVFLTSRSFLVAGPNVTLADCDLYLAIAEATKKANVELKDLVRKEQVNVGRWLGQVGVTLDGLGEFAPGGEVKVEVAYKAPPAVIPVFYYGDEGDDEIAAAAIASAAAAPASGEDKKTQKGKGEGGAPKGAGGGGELTAEQKAAAADKRAKKAAEKSAKKKEKAAKQPKGGKGDSAPAADLNISALDIRVGKIIRAWNHETADKLYCEEVDVGEDKPRSIASGLRPFYKLDDMQERLVLVLCNLKARNLVGFPSHGMVLCASNADHTAVEFAVPPEGAKVGERLVFEGFDGDAEPENKVAKKKMFEKLAPDLKTDGQGMVVWKGAKGMTSAGQARAVNGMAGAQVS